MQIPSFIMTCMRCNKERCKVDTSVPSEHVFTHLNELSIPGKLDNANSIGK